MINQIGYLNSFTKLAPIRRKLIDKIGDETGGKFAYSFKLLNLCEAIRETLK